MKMKPEKPALDLFKGVLLAHLILGLHVALICLIGLVVIFFGGIARYWAWIFLGGLGLMAAGAFYAYRRLKSQGRHLMRDLQGVAVPSGGTLEVRLLGGLASVKFARPGAPAVPGIASSPGAPLLEDPEAQRLRELSYLAQLYEKNLITREEFDRAKGTLFSSAHRAGFGAGTLNN
jgi:hypothetical protein